MCPWRGKLLDLTMHLELCAFVELKPLLTIMTKKLADQENLIRDYDNRIKILESVHPKPKPKSQKPKKQEKKVPTQSELVVLTLKKLKLMKENDYPQDIKQLRNIIERIKIAFKLSSVPKYELFTWYSDTFLTRSKPIIDKLISTEIVQIEGKKVYVDRVRLLSIVLKE